MRTRTILCATFFILTFATSVIAQPQSVLTFDPDRAIDRIVVSLSASPPVDTGHPDSAMTLRLRAILAELDAAESREFRAAGVRAGKSPAIPPDAVPVCYLHIYAGKLLRTAELIRLESSETFLREVTDPADPAPPNATPRSGPRVTRLDPDKLIKFKWSWCTYRGTFTPRDPNPEFPPGRISELARPFIPSPVPFDKAGLGRRLLSGRTTSLAGSSRHLGDHTISLRPPRNYSPRSPAGLLVWVSPVYQGPPPASFFEACDELNLVCVGANGVQNETPLPDRCQMVFDSLATAAARTHIDPARVYITGMSGGGKIASMLWLSFADLFAGSVPIVGLAHYENIPIGDGRAWPGTFAPPPRSIAALARLQRCGTITGNVDFNYEPILAAAKLYERDGYTLRVFTHEGMGHTMPTPADFTEAMRWVDEPAQRRLEERSANAEKRLAEARVLPSARLGERVKKLIDVTEIAPWSSAAWTAVDDLRSLSPSDSPAQAPPLPPSPR